MSLENESSKFLFLDKILFIFLLLFLLTGCQSNIADNSSDNIYKEANEVFLIIKNNGLNESLNDYNEMKIDKFKEKYINNADKYENEKELLSEMESLINSYRLYYVSIGMKDKKSEDFYKKSFDIAIKKLDKKFESLNK